MSTGDGSFRVGTVSFGMGEDDRESVQESAEQRKNERAEEVESLLSDVREDLGDHKYPVSSEEIAAEYANEPSGLKNETESIGSVFRRLDETFEDEEAAYEAFASEFATDDPASRQASASTGPPYWDEDRVTNREHIDNTRQEQGETVDENAVGPDDLDHVETEETDDDDEDSEESAT